MKYHRESDMIPNLVIYPQIPEYECHDVLLSVLVTLLWLHMVHQDTKSKIYLSVIDSY